MKRSVGWERVYSLGQYKTLRVTDEVSDLPDELIFDSEFTDKIRILQMVNSDLVFNKYFRMAAKLEQYPAGSNETENALLEIRANTLEDITNLLNKKIEAYKQSLE
jgi:hypothetical protein